MKPFFSFLFLLVNSCPTSRKARLFSRFSIHLCLTPPSMQSRCCFPIYMCIHTHTHIFINTYIYTHTHTHIHAYIYMHTHLEFAVFLLAPCTYRSQEDKQNHPITAASSIGLSYMQQLGCFHNSFWGAALLVHRCWIGLFL